jgi:hypothetical protein
MACVDRKPPSKGTSLKLPCPSAFPVSRAPFFASPFEEAFGRLCPASRKSRPQGLATLPADLAPRSLGDLFQPPTLVGFPLRSFSPLRWSVPGLPVPFRPCTFFQDLPALGRCSGDLLPPRSRVPSPRGFRSGRDLLLPWAFGPLRLSLRSGQVKTVFFLTFPSRPLIPATSQPQRPGTPGVLLPSGLALSPRKGRRPVWPFPPTASPTS